MALSTPSTLLMAPLALAQSWLVLSIAVESLFTGSSAKTHPRGRALELPMLPRGRRES